MLSKYQLFHGAVLIQVCRNPAFSLKLIERDEKKHGWGMYYIGTDRKDYVLFIKSSSKVKKGRNYDYSNFTFSIDDIRRIKKHENKDFLICLVCDEQEICLLDDADISKLKILESLKSCGISVHWRQGSELTVKSTFAELERKIPRRRLKNFNW